MSNNNDVNINIYESSVLNSLDNFKSEHILSIEESELMMNELNNLVEQLRQRKKSFKDKSRLFCCGFFSFCMVLLFIVFYIFDVVKYEQTCRKSKKLQVEICNAPSLGIWTRFIFVTSIIVFLVIGLYCTGTTVIIFEPKENKLRIDKKKFFFLPSVCEYSLENLSHACIESDASDGAPNLSTFYFYSVTLVFNCENDKVVNLGLGRDCFFLQEKIDLVKSINKYLKAIKNSY